MTSRGLRSRARLKRDETRRDKTRLEGNSPIGGTGTRLLHYGPVARENPGKSREINGTGRDYFMSSSHNTMHGPGSPSSSHANLASQTA